MQPETAWDWEIGNKPVLILSSCSSEYRWQEEPCVSPDGEKIANVVNLDDALFGVCVNGELWEENFEKIWGLRFGPDNRLRAIVSRDAEWTLAVDGETWPDWYGFLWDVKLSRDGGVIAAAIQNDMVYGMAVNGRPWSKLFENANNYSLSPDGAASAAVVQTRAFGEADIAAFQEGCYTVAVDGQAWDTNFVNVWTPVFDAEGKQTAAQVRVNLYDYTIALNGKAWARTFQGIWEPIFHPVTGAVIAPVRQAGAWGVAMGRGRSSGPHNTISAGNWTSAPMEKPWPPSWPAVTGRFTISVNSRAWETTCPVITDMTMSPRRPSGRGVRAARGTLVPDRGFREKGRSV